MTAIPAALQLRLTQYFESSAIPIDKATKVDVVLGLLRLGGKDARQLAQQLAGVPIRIFPATPPPWPPKPVAKVSKTVLIRRGDNPCLPTTDAFQRYRRLRVGMTREQLIARGLTTRDLTDWSKRGHIEFGVRS